MCSRRWKLIFMSLNFKKKICFMRIYCSSITRKMTSLRSMLMSSFKLLYQIRLQNQNFTNWWRNIWFIKTARIKSTLYVIIKTIIALNVFQNRCSMLRIFFIFLIIFNIVVRIKNEFQTRYEIIFEWCFIIHIFWKNIKFIWMSRYAH